MDENEDFEEGDLYDEADLEAGRVKQKPVIPATEETEVETVPEEEAEACSERQELMAMNRRKGLE